MKKALSLCIALVMVLSLLSAAPLAQAFLSVPPANKYYSIASATDLYNFGKQLHMGNPDYATAYVRLENSIDMTAYADAWISGYFEGVFAGEGNTISNLQSHNGGLFADLGFGGCIMDLTITDSSISNFGPAQPAYIGAFADQCKGVIMNCTLTNSKIAGDCAGVGGFVGLQMLNQNTAHGYDISEDPSIAPLQATYYIDDSMSLTTGGILSCTTDVGCVIENTRQFLSDYDTGSLQVGAAGGFVGVTQGGILDDCINESSVIGLRPGGIVGISQEGTLIRYCENRGKIIMPEMVTDLQVEEPNPSNPNPNTLAFEMQTIVDSYAGKRGSVYQLAAGGIIALALRGGTNVLNCMNYGPVSGLFNVGGIVGYLLDPGAMLVNCGNDSKYCGQYLGSALSGVYNVGGLIGHLSAGLADGLSEHQNLYTASFPSAAAVIFNSYNAMPMQANGLFDSAYVDGVFGGLVGRMDGSDDGESFPSLENCHNAAIPLKDEISSGVIAEAGSLIGVLDGCRPHVIHCFGAINDRTAWNFTLNRWGTMLEDYANFRLIGTDGSGIQLAPGFFFDNGMYVMDQTLLDDYVDPPREPLVCGGVLIYEGIANPSNYHLLTGIFSGSVHLLDELNAYVTQFQVTCADAQGRYFNLISMMQPWYCAEPLHANGITGCTEYAVFQSGRAYFYPPIAVDGPEPGADFLTPVDPDVVVFDPNEPGTVVTHSLSLNGDICVNFYVSIPAPDANCHMEFNFCNETLTVPIDLGQTITRNGLVLYKFSCPLNASQTSADVQATLWLTDDGTIDPNANWGPIYKGGFYGKMLESYSVNQYLEEISGNIIYQNNEPLMNLMRSISVYSNYANELFGTDPDFMPSVLFDASAIDGIDAAALANYAAVTEDYGNEITYFGSSLVLRTTTAIHHYFTLAQGQDIEDYRFVCTNTGEELTPEPNGRYYCIKIPNIGSGKLGLNYSVEVYAPGVTAPVSVWNYSGLSYAYKVLTEYENGGNISDELANVARALYVYYTCADAYFN